MNMSLRHPGTVDRVAAGFHPPVEEYLKTIYELCEEGVPVIRARLAERTGHSAPTVTETVRRLSTGGLVETSGRLIRLSERGNELAERVVRRHRLAERLLADVIGLDWPKVHQEAGRWEHVISDDVEASLVLLLGNPATCPHGNPIPGSGTPAEHARPLAESAVGETVRLVRISETAECDIDTLLYLDAHGLRPGALAEVMERGPDGTLSLEVSGDAFGIGPSMAAELFVAVDAPA